MQWVQDLYSTSLWVADNSKLLVTAILIVIITAFGILLMLARKDKRTALLDWLLGGIIVGSFISLSGVGLANMIVDKFSSF